MPKKVIKDSNFSWIEFSFSLLANHEAKLNDINRWLITYMVEHILQPIRNEFGAVKIESGVRDTFIWKVLDDHGYKPSKTTDHSFLDPELNSYGVGAVDFVTYEANLNRVYKEVYKRVKNHDMYIGQLILYPTRGIIHISNPKELVFSANFLRENNLNIKEQFLVYSPEEGYQKCDPKELL